MFPLQGRGQALVALCFFCRLDSRPGSWCDSWRDAGRWGWRRRDIGYALYCHNGIVLLKKSAADRQRIVFEVAEDAQAKLGLPEGCQCACDTGRVDGLA